MAKPIWIGHVTAAIISFLAAFFSVLNVLFSDVFGLTRHLQAIGYVLVVYGFFGFVLTLIWPAGRRAWRWWLIAPALLIGLPFSFGDGTFGWYPFGVLAAVVIGTIVGTRFGSQTRANVVRARQG